MLAEYEKLDGFNISLVMEPDDKRNVYGTSYFYMPYIVGLVFEALANSIEFTIDEFMDDCGTFYGFGEPLYFGNDYAVYPFVIDTIDVTTLYYLTPENLQELERDGRTIIEAVC